MDRIRLAEVMPNGAPGGRARSVRDLIAGLDRRLVEAEFFFFGDGGWLSEELVRLGYRCHYFGWAGGPAVSARYRLVKELRRFCPDVIHDHGLPILIRPCLKLFLPRALSFTSEHTP